MSSERQLSARLRAARQRAALTQAELGTELGERYDRSMIGHVEAGRSGLLVDGLAKAAGALKVSTDYLLGLTDDSTPAADLSHALRAHSGAEATRRDDQGGEQSADAVPAPTEGFGVPIALKPDR